MVSADATNVSTHSTKEIQGEQWKVIKTYLCKLQMQNNQKMIFEVFIHSDEMTCFHVVVQGTQKVIMTSHCNFKDRELIKRQWATQKTNKMDEKPMDENKQSNRCMSFLFPTKGHVFSQSYNVHWIVNVESAIEKLQRVAREKEA